MGIAGASRNTSCNSFIRAALSRPMLMLQSDDRLVALTRNGSEDAFEAIVERYRKPLLGYCARLLDRARAEDVVQHTFESAFKQLVADNRPMQLKAWLYRVAHNRAIDAVRKNGWDHDQLDPSFDYAGVPQPHDVLKRREELNTLVTRITGRAGIEPWRRQANPLPCAHAVAGADESDGVAEVGAAVVAAGVIAVGAGTVVSADGADAAVGRSG
jgi:hypothetical protein